jgi:hypothetical protein
MLMANICACSLFEQLKHGYLDFQLMKSFAHVLAMCYLAWHYVEGHTIVKNEKNILPCKSEVKVFADLAYPRVVGLGR